MSKENTLRKKLRSEAIETAINIGKVLDKSSTTGHNPNEYKQINEENVKSISPSKPKSKLISDLRRVLDAHDIDVFDEDVNKNVTKFVKYLESL